VIFVGYKYIRMIGKSTGPKESIIAGRYKSKNHKLRVSHIYITV
jgi:hypothetical protein